MDSIEAMSTAELYKLKAKINQEILNRTEKKVMYQHDCFGSARYHFANYKHWSKIVTAVDVTKATAYGFIGDFLNVHITNVVPLHSIIVECCGVTYRVYEVMGDYNKMELYNCRKNHIVECLLKVEQILRREEK